MGSRRVGRDWVTELNWRELIFIGRTDAQAEAPILWLPDAKRRYVGKRPDAVKDWGQEEKGVTEDEMVGGHHQLNEHEFEQTLGDSEGWESLVCWNPLGHKDGTWPRGWTTKQLERRSFHQLRWGNLKGMEIRKPVLGMLNWRCLENSEIHWKTIYLLS